MYPSLAEESGLRNEARTVQPVAAPFASRHSVSLWRRVDLVCLSFAMLLVVLTAMANGQHLRWAELVLLRVSAINLVLAIGCLALWHTALSVVEVLLNEFANTAERMVANLGLKVGLCTALTCLAFWSRHPERAFLFLALRFGLLSLLLLATCRLVHALYTGHISPALRRERGVLIVGSGVRARAIAEEIKAHPRWRYNVLGFVDDPERASGEAMLGSITDLDTLLMKRVVDEVIIALPIKSMYDEIQQAIAACERLGVQSCYSMDFFSTRVAKRRSAVEQDGSVVLHMVHNDSRRHLKRALDIFGALFGLFMLAPVMLGVALAIKLSSPGPVFFCQPRFGLNKRVFTMLKFRSMVVDAERQQAKLEHLNEAGGPVFKIRKDPRVTAIGRLIRKTSLDELPQLINVLRGDMSLVGPRPLPTRDVGRFPEAWLMRRFSVRPGLTGLWQVSGRSDTTFANWIQFDLTYIDTWSLALDLRILARTLPAVLRGQGAS